MIVVDSSALMAILLDEPSADACQAVLGREDDFAISAATAVEALIVADGRGLRHRMERLIEGSGFEIVELTASRVQLVADAYRRWGKGHHRASLNFGDCFAYALAEERNCPLLFVGNDFAQTDIVSAIAST